MKKGDCNCVCLLSRKGCSEAEKKHDYGDSDWSEEALKVAEEFVHYFQNIFQSEGITQEEVINSIQGHITASMNAALVKQFSSLEIKQALFDMNPSKAPGADGMTARFYKKY